MTQQTVTSGGVAASGTSCDRPTAITRSLLAYGVIAGPFYVTVSLLQAVTRDGFDLASHPWSVLSNGELGWIHITNLVVTGLMCIAFAVGLRRALGTGRGRVWAPRLIGVYGASMVAAGVFRADPVLGFPPGTPQGAAEVSWHGVAHFMSGGVGFTCLIVACFVLARRFAADASQGWARFSRAVGALFLAGFVAVAAGSGAVWANLAFTGAVVLVWVWFSGLAMRLYGRAAHRADG